MCLKQCPDNIVVLSNLAAVYIELKEYAQALQHAQDGLKVDGSHVKCLYRSGVAFMHLEQYTNAIERLKTAKQQVKTVKLHVLQHVLSAVASFLVFAECTHNQRHHLHVQRCAGTK